MKQFHVVGYLIMLICYDARLRQNARTFNHSGFQSQRLTTPGAPASATSGDRTVMGRVKQQMSSARPNNCTNLLQ